MKWRTLVECVYYLGLKVFSLCTVCLVIVTFAHFYMLSAFCPLLCSDCFMFILIIRFMFVSLFCMFCFLFCGSVFLSVLWIVSPHVYSFLFSVCVQFYRPLPPGGNPFAVNKYLIISYHIYQMLHRVLDVDGFRGMTTLRAVVSAVMYLWVP